MRMTEPEVRVTVTHGEVPPHDRRYLAAKVATSASMAPAPVLQADATLTVSTNPADPRPVTATAVLDVNGRSVRAQVAAAAPREAADLLEARLQQQLEHLTERRLARRSRDPHPVAGSWRHGMLPQARPPFHPRPVEERDVVPRASFAARALTADEAAEEMALLDHDFHLFIEAGTGVDALVEHDEDGLRLTRAADPDGAITHVPELTVPEAVQALEDGQLPRLFFLDRDASRGAVVYHRYDGHYGLVTAPSS
jgi:ribosome-associated translation inhibitor RaiA